MSQICYETIKITTAGGAGAAVGSAVTVPIQGFLLDVYIEYHASAPATTDLAITDPVFGTIFSVSNSNTDRWYAPRKQTSDYIGVSTGLYDLIPINSALTISIAQADALTDCVTVTLRYITP
ncbi:MAG: hypothetical protein WAV05_11890 [Anaerolineales bacterium]